MFLERMEVENIRSISSAVKFDFTDLTLDRSAVRKWSLLVGENGTGKSTLLKAAALLLAGSDALLHLIGNGKFWVRHGAAAGRISARLRTAEWEPRDISLEIKPEYSPKDVITYNASTLSLLDEALRHASQNYFVASYGPYRRVSEESTVLATPQSSSPRAQCLATLFDKNAVVHPLPAWAMTLEYRKGEEGLEIVKDALNALMPDVSFDGVDKELGTLRFQTIDGIVTLGELSDGYQNLAAWIGDLLFRITEAFAHHRQPLHARGLLLIDEIDAHLHPAWQRKLREFLTAKLPNFQIIATSHSALTVQQAHEGEVFILTRDENKIVRAADFPGDPSKLRLHQLYDLAFRISSLDSWEIEKSKEIYRELSTRPTADLSPQEREKLGAAQAKLEAIPAERDDSLGNQALDRYFSKLDRITDTLAARASEA